MSLFGNGYGIKDFVPPVDNARITSTEGNRKAFKTDNGAMSSSFHRGIDVASTGKVPVKNITGGTVVFAGKINGYGNAVIVKNPEGYTVQYSHLDGINVKAGQQIPAGSPVGVMGATGNATGVHLDMMVAKDGKAINRDGQAFGSMNTGMAKRANTPVANSAAAQPVQMTPMPIAQTMPVAQSTPPILPNTTPAVSQPQLVQNQSTPQTTTANSSEYDIFSTKQDPIYDIALSTVKRAASTLLNKPLLDSNPIDYGLEKLYDTVDTNGSQSSTSSTNT